MRDKRDQPQRVGNEKRYTVGHGGLKVTVESRDELYAILREKR